MSELDDIDALAAEYVLGTLDAGERAAVSARRLREPALEAAILGWERRLAPLVARAGEAMPSPGLLPRIEQRIEALGAEGGAQAGGDVVRLLESRVRRWRMIAGGASALAACLALVIGLRESLPPPGPQNYVAVFNQGDVLPSFTMTIDLATRQVTVRPIGAARAPGRTYQLWIASDQLGPNPRSLGLIGDGSGPGKALLTAYEPALLQRATFGVSLEPAGGSPTGLPTSPALHATLQPALP